MQIIALAREHRLRDRICGPYLLAVAGRRRSQPHDSETVRARETHARLIPRSTARACPLTSAVVHPRVRTDCAMSRCTAVETSRAEMSAGVRAPRRPRREQKSASG